MLKRITKIIKKVDMNKVKNIIIILLIFNFIPIKFAKSDSDIEYYTNTDKEVYTCGITVSTGIYSVLRQNGNKETPDFYKIIGNSPYFVLNDDFDELKYLNDYSNLSHNSYLITGKTLSYKDINIFITDDWEIFYPIRRSSILRELISSEFFLTIYDYNWFCVLMVIFWKYWFIIAPLIIIVILKRKKGYLRKLLFIINKII